MCISGACVGRGRLSNMRTTSISFTVSGIGENSILSICIASTTPIISPTFLIADVSFATSIVSISSTTVESTTILSSCSINSSSTGTMFSIVTIFSTTRLSADVCENTIRAPSALAT